MSIENYNLHWVIINLRPELSSDIYPVHGSENLILWTCQLSLIQSMDSVQSQSNSQSVCWGSGEFAHWFKNTKEVKKSRWAKIPLKKSTNGKLKVLATWFQELLQIYSNKEYIMLV